jgi:hypothetical protein
LADDHQLAGVVHQLDAVDTTDARGRRPVHAARG